MRKDNLSSEDINPGQELKKVLENLYPLNQEELSFVGEIDRSFKEDGKLVEIFYQSTINYLIRRLINTTEYLKREHESSELQNKLFITKLRNFFQQETWIDDENIERLISILQLCIDEKRRKRKSKKKDLIKNRIEILCYVCGKSLEEDKVEVEHMWPKSMGGITLSSNLKVCCSECNKNKEQYIDASDFHYEQISLGTRKSDDSFEREFRGVYKVALSAKSDYSCSLCGQPVEVVGRLNFVQRNPNDSWHFLNIDGICNSCISLGDQNGD